MIIDLSKIHVMGIVNCTPDSFYIGSRKTFENEVLTTVDRMLTDGANSIDIGAFSTRPNCELISVETEIERIIPIISCILKTFPTAILSVDTFRAKVAQQALDLGVKIVNDISGGLFDNQLFKTISPYDCAYILMHLRGTLETMHEPQNYSGIIDNIISELEIQIQKAENNGIAEIIIDPGFGFSKNLTQNIALFNGIDELKQLRKPMLIGISRKSMIYKTLGGNAENALNGTSVLNLIALQKGAHILRVHDVKEAVETVKLFEIFG